jgi:hypothetical protein
MKVYETAWAGVCATAAVLGASVVYLLAPGVLLVLGVSFGFVGAILAFTLSDRYWEQTRLGRVRILGRGALLGALAAGGFAGHVVLLGAGVFLLALAVVAASPPVARRYARWLGAARDAAPNLDQVAGALADGVPELAALPTAWDIQRTSQTDSPEQSGADAELGALTDEQLCRQWRATYTTLAAVAAAEKERVVAHRQRLLDELARRHSVEFAAWLASNPRSAGNPLPYLQGRRASRCRIDWNELITGQDC